MRRFFRHFVWINILIQFLFPVTVAFTPAMAGAGSNKRFLNPTAGEQLNTQVYTLQPGETAESVAAKFNMSMAALKKLNQLRTFARGFDNLQAGDELDVPTSPLPEIVWGESASAMSTDNEQAKNIAGVASKAGNFLASNPHSDAAASMARGMATSAAGSEIQEFLNNFGSARVQLEADKNFTLKNSQLDLLVPVYDRDNTVTFTQGSLHRTDDRSQTNLGVGIRHFTSGYMLGANLFGDYDLSRDHARAGIGTEYWRDFLKLSANGYFGLTSWKNSPDVRDHEERPANGWDIRTQGWLPAVPQLGGKLTWEQYYGKEVALFGKDNRQSNPHAMTVGLEYTPVPLLTLSAEQRQGRSGQNDTRLGLGLNYRLGVPWHHQVDPGMVASMRSLIGSRYDLVDRNNNIVLEYRKQDALRIDLPEVMEAEASRTIVIPVTVQKSKYGVKDTEWTPSQAFLEQGGSLHKRSAIELEVRVPAWNYSAPDAAKQEYTLTAVSIDNNGRRSNTATTLIRVLPAQSDIETLSVTPDEAVIADNVQFATLTASIKDASGAVVPGQALTFSVEGLNDAQNASAATLFTDTQSHNKQLAVVTDARGQAAVMLRSKVAKKGTVTVKMDNGKIKTVPVTFTADTESASVASLTVTKNDAHANGVDANEIEAVVHDVHGNPLANFTVEADVDNDGVVDISSSTDVNGRTTLRVTNERAGETTVTVRSGSMARAFKVATVHFHVDKSATHIAAGDLTVDTGAKADGTDSNALTVKVTDSNGNVAKDVTLEISASGTAGNAVVTPSVVQTDNNGLASAAVTSLKAGQFTVTAVVRESGKSANATTEFVSDDATATITDSNMHVTSGAKADGKLTNSVQVIVTDAQGNFVPGVSVSFVADNAAVKFAESAPTTDTNGAASATMTSTLAGQFKITATVGNVSRNMDTTFIADISTAQIIADNLTVGTGALADGTDKNTVQAIVTDAEGNLVSGASVTFGVSGDGSKTIITTLKGITGSDGVATAEVTSKEAGSFTVTAAVAGKETTKVTEFVADSSTARITDSDLVVTSGAVADGSDKNTVQATVTDAEGNLVSGASVTFGVSGDSSKTVITALTGITGSDGVATAEVTSKESGAFTVTAALPSGNKTEKMVEFVAGTIHDVYTTLITDKQSYVAGEKVLLKLTMKDAQGNLIKGELPDGWEYSVPGTAIDGMMYVDSSGAIISPLMAINSGNYQASFTWNGGTVTSNAYVISTGEVSVERSTIETNAGTYRSGEDITVTVTLEDSYGNRVDSLVNQLSTSTISVPNAVLKSTDGWKEHGDGVYSIIYQAVTTGSLKRASLKMPHWSETIRSAFYAISAGEPVRENSSLEMASSFIVGDDINITVSLKDAAGNAVTGYADEIVLTMANTIEKSGAWHDNNNGTYTSVYTASGTASGFARLKLADWETHIASMYTIKSVSLKSVAINGYEFSPTAGVPQTGFKNASFTLTLSDDVDASAYEWTANQPWVTVTDGIVTFIDDAGTSIVEIKGKRKNGHDSIGAITYVFQTKKWFWFPVGNERTWDNARNLCINNGYVQPEASQVYISSASGSRFVGALKNEWGGNLAVYDVGGLAWLADAGISNSKLRRVTDLYTNTIFESDPSGASYKAMCVR
ncbi:inverse autotransporter beta domain-containing protein [Kluyvera sp. Awk 3]|uniref:inverse autotransporter beta domain-containing protein n=1 Tax=Kluyvera sp. Awk 3 TaxID=2963956 RepID=UPI0023031CCC|nr:inverse autotransporter beta domain-containing protein [Kluyvera sp. Awk 3]MDA8491367.1 inverse autotransporter beta domain-containing protein [Kluyvera sp. Awk 3]